MADSDIILKIGADTAQIKKDLDALKNYFDKDPIGKDAGKSVQNSFSLAFTEINSGIELIKKAFSIADTII